MAPVSVRRKSACCSSSKIGGVPKGTLPYPKIDCFWACRIVSGWLRVLDSIQDKAAGIFFEPHISVTKNKRSKCQPVRMKRSMNWKTLYDDTNEEEREE